MSLLCRDASKPKEGPKAGSIAGSQQVFQKLYPRENCMTRGLVSVELYTPKPDELRSKPLVRCVEADGIRNVEHFPGELQLLLFGDRPLLAQSCVDSEISGPAQDVAPLSPG